VTSPERDHELAWVNGVVSMDMHSGGHSFAAGSFPERPRVDIVPYELYAK
jgi:hypothetical protein